MCVGRPTHGLRGRLPWTAESSPKLTSVCASCWACEAISPGLANSAHKALRSALPVPRFNYGMPERLIPLIDQGVGDEPIIHDLVSFLSGKLNKKISYLEIGPSSPFRVLVCAARTLNVPGQSRVTLSLQ